MRQPLASARWNELFGRFVSIGRSVQANRHRERILKLPLCPIVPKESSHPWVSFLALFVPSPSHVNPPIDAPLLLAVPVLLPVLGLPEPQLDGQIGCSPVEVFIFFFGISCTLFLSPYARLSLSPNLSLDALKRFRMIQR